MTAYSYNQLLGFAQQAGFSGANANIIAAIAMAESSGQSNAYNVNTDGSIDRGILQINNFYHPEVSDSCAYNPTCAFASAYRISQSGTNFTPWGTYNNGDFRAYLSGTNNAGVSSSTPTVNLSASGANPLQSLADLQSMVGSLTSAPVWGWLTSPVRVIKMTSGIAVLLIAILMLFAPDAINKVVKNVGNGKTPINPLD